MPLRLLIVAHYFPPLHSVGALRPAAWARHWSEAGHEVHVLTTRKLPADGMLDPASSAPGAIVHEVSYGEWLHPVMAPRASKREGERRPLVLRRSVLRWLKRSLLGNYADYRLLWIRPAIAAGEELLRRFAFDAVITTAPPFPVHIVGAALKSRRARMIWVADYRDPWSGSHLFPGIAATRTLERWHERRTLRHADLVATVSEPLAAYLQRVLRRPVEVISNGYDAGEWTATDGAGAQPRDARCRVVVHTGTVYEAGHDVETLLRALERLAARPDSAQAPLELRFFGESGTLDAALRRYPAAARFVRQMGIVPRAQALQAQRSADAVLFFDWNDHSTESSGGVMSGKIFEYLASGTEILAVGGRNTDVVAQLLEQTAAGTWCGDDAGRLAGALERIQAEGGRRVAPRWDLLAPYERRATSLRLLDRIRSALPQQTTKAAA